MRPERISDADRQAAAILLFTRPRGYFDAERDAMQFDGQSPPPGVPATGAGIASSTLKLAAPTGRAVPAEFNGERLVGRTWSAVGQHVVVLELTY
jgi:hypothetical protein